MRDLFTQFRNLTPTSRESSSVESFSGVPLTDSGNRHLGKDSFGRPAILLRVSVDPKTGQPFGAELENLRVEHGLSCRITTSAGEVESGEFTIIQCLSTEPVLHEYFLKTIDRILDDLPSPVRGSQINLLVTNLVSLFRALGQPPSKPTTGLWAELFLMARSAAPKQMLQAWHSEAVERYDFSWDSDRLEVKASTNRSRTHHFSYDQVYPPRSVTVIVASLFVQSSPTGTSVKDLWDQLRAVADDSDMRLKLERICLETLGDTWQHAVSKSYDQQIAEESLAFFDVARVPKVSEDQPTGVSDIRFRSDLSEADPVAISSNRYSGRLFSCLTGR